VIRVGGATEIEVKEKKDRVEDALNATRAAVQEGIVPGGGTALLRAKKALGRIHNENADVQAGINIVLKALEAPIRQIAENAASRARSWSARSSTTRPRPSASTPRTRTMSTGRQGHHRSRQGRAHRAAGRRLGRRPPRHHGSHGRRAAEGRRARDAGRRRNGCMGGMGGMGF